MQKLVIEKGFMGCHIISTQERTSIFKVQWTSSSNMLIAMGKSLEGLLKYLKGLRSNVINPLKDSFKVQELYGDLISYRYMMLP